MRNYLIKKIENYDAGKMTNAQLGDDWRIIVMFFSSMKKGKKFQFTEKQLLETARRIKKEIDRRVESGKMNFTFKADTQIEKELMKHLEYMPIFHGTSSRRSSEISLDDILSRLRNFKVRTPLAWIVGSLANWERTDGDVDVLINASYSDPLFRVVQFRIMRAFPVSMRDRIHCLPNDERMGPFTSAIPIYDLVADAGERKRIEMSDSFDRDAEASRRENKIELMRSFYMQKPTHGREVDEIYSIGSVLRTIETLKWSGHLAVEIKRDGVTAQAHKKGKEVKVWTEQGTLLNLPEIEKELSERNDDFIVIGELELFIEGKHQPRAAAAGILNSGADKGNIRFTLYDKLYMNGDIHNAPYAERRKALETLTESEHVKINQKIVVGIDDNAIKNAIDQVSNIPGSEGAMLKLLSGKYELDKKTSNQIKFKKERVLIGKVVEAHKVAEAAAWNYDMAVDGSPYVGKTYNTSLKAEKGDKLKIVFVDISEYHDGKTVWFNYWAPRVVQLMPRSAETTPISELHKMVEETTGRIQDKRVPSRFSAPLPEGVKTLSRSEGLYLVAPHAEWIFEGKKKLIVKSREFDVIGKKMILIDNDYAYGKIEIKNIEKMSLKEFEARKTEHLISDEVRKKWWDDSELFAYSFVFSPFDNPVKVEIPRGVQTFVKDVKFLGDVHIAVDPAGFVEADAYVLTKPSDALKKGTAKPVFAPAEVFEKMAETPFEDINVISEGERFEVKGVQFVFREGKIKALTELANRYRYVAQLHFRGRSSHLDFRFEKDDHLEGFTLAVQATEEIKKPVLTMGDAIAELRDASNWKMDFASLEVKERDGKKKISCLPKARQPKVWLDTEGVTEEQEPGEPIPVGATKRFPGVFLIVDKGLFEQGADKPDFKEFFTQKGRIVFRFIPGLKGMKWEYWKPDDQTPYVLSDGAVKQGWMPPTGKSALPSSWEKKVPATLRFWEHGSKAGVTRDGLVAFLKEKKELSQDKFVLSRRSYKGQKVIRDMPVLNYYLKFGSHRFDLDRGNPLFDSALNANETSEEKFFIPGIYAPSSPINPNKKIPAEVSIVDSGDVTVIEDSELFINVDFSGKLLKGKWVFKRKSPSEKLWEMNKSRSPKTMSLANLEFLRKNSNKMSRKELAAAIGFAPFNVWRAQKKLGI